MTFQNTNTDATTQPQAVIDRATLTSAVSALVDIVERRATIQALAALRVTGEGDRVFITSTDLDIELVACVPCAADSRFDALIPAYKLRDMLKKARKSEYAALTLSEGQPETETMRAVEASVAIEFDKVRYDLTSPDMEHFPTMTPPAHNEAHRFSMAGKTLVDAIGRTMGAMSTEETRYYLNGVYMHHDCDQLRFVATDGHRIYLQDIDAPEGATDAMPGVIIPRKTINTLHKLTKGKATPEGFTVAVTESKAQFSWVGADGVTYTMTTKIVDGTFPDYKRVIPGNCTMTMVANSDELAGALADVSIVSDQRGRAIKLCLGDDDATVGVNNPDIGTASADFDVDYTGEPLEIGFNAQYVTDILKLAEGDTIEARFQDAGSPTIITGEAEGWKAVLMPMRA